MKPVPQLSPEEQEEREKQKAANQRLLSSRACDIPGDWAASGETEIEYPEVNDPDALGKKPRHGYVNLD